MQTLKPARLRTEDTIDLQYWRLSSSRHRGGTVPLYRVTFSNKNNEMISFLSAEDEDTCQAGTYQANERGSFKAPACWHQSRLGSADCFEPDVCIIELLGC